MYNPSLAEDSVSTQELSGGIISGEVVIIDVTADRDLVRLIYTLCEKVNV